MRTRFSASCRSALNSVDTSLMPASEAPRTHWMTEAPGCSCDGKRSTDIVEQDVIGLGPVVQERRPQPVDGGAADLEMGVAPLRRIPGVALPLVGDPDAARESGRLVDDHDLAMGAVVHLLRLEVLQRPEPPHQHAGVLHLIDERPFDRMRPPAVEQEPDADARASALRQCFGESRADLALPVDESQEVDRVTGARDRIQHHREDLIAVAQDLDALPSVMGTPMMPSSVRRDAPLVRSVTVTRHRAVRRRRLRRARAPSRRPAARCAPARTASSWAATRRAVEERDRRGSAQSISATMPASGP